MYICFAYLPGCRINVHPLAVYPDKISNDYFAKVVVHILYIVAQYLRSIIGQVLFETLNEMLLI